MSEAVPFCWMCRATTGKRAKEHLFARELIKALGADGERAAPVRISLPHGGVVASKRPQVPVGSLLAGEVCDRCNNGWMNDLEEPFRSNVLRRPRRGRLTETEARALARWFTKTAVIINVSMPFRLLFDAPTRHALAAGMPNNVVVGLYRVRMMDGAVDWVQSTLQHAVVPSGARGDWVRDVLALSYVGRVRVQDVVGVVIVLPDPLRAEHLDAPFAQIWPLPQKLPTWGALPVFDHYLKPSFGADFPPDWLPSPFLARV